MPDLALCVNAACPSAKLCYLFMAKPDRMYQSYGNFQPEPGEDRCGSYVKWREREEA